MKDAFIKGNGLFNTSTKYVYSEKRYFERTMIHFGKEGENLNLSSILFKKVGRVSKYLGVEREGGVKYSG